MKVRENTLGPEHPEVATSLNNLALLLKAQGDYTAARPLYERALKIRENSLGPDHPEVATSLNNLAALLQLPRTDYTAARPLYERALKIREKIFGPDHPEVATILNNLALVIKVQGEYALLRNVQRNYDALLQLKAAYAEARPLYERALKIKEKTLGPDHPAVATSLDNLAGLLQVPARLYRSTATIRAGIEDQGKSAWSGPSPCSHKPQQLGFAN